MYVFVKAIRVSSRTTSSSCVTASLSIPNSEPCHLTCVIRVNHHIPVQHEYLETRRIHVLAYQTPAEGMLGYRGMATFQHEDPPSPYHSRRMPVRMQDRPWQRVNQLARLVIQPKLEQLPVGGFIKNDIQAKAQEDRYRHTTSWKMAWTPLATRATHKRYTVPPQMSSNTRPTGTRTPSVCPAPTKRVVHSPPSRHHIARIVQDPVRKRRTIVRG